jgi:hypothetical protein
VSTDLENADGEYAENGCLLAEVDPDTGIPTCIDNTLQQINWPSEQEPEKNPAIQFDNAGRIYYSGYTESGRTVLRRYDNGSVKDLINDNIGLDDFLVQPDGSVIVGGQTTNTGAQWVRRITPAGGLQTLVGGTSSQFLRAFPDGNVCLGVWGTGNFGVRRYLTGPAQVESKYWISDNINSETPEKYFSAGDFCQPSDFPQNEGFCGTFGALILGSHTTTDGNVYVAAGSEANGVLMRYFPTIDQTATQVARPRSCRA